MTTTSCHILSEKIETRLRQIAVAPGVPSYTEGPLNAAADTIAALRQQLHDLEQMRQRDLDLAERHMEEKHALRQERDEAREWSRLRDADIITLGQELGEARERIRVETDTARMYLTRADEARAEMERLTRERDELEAYLIEGAYEYGTTIATFEKRAEAAEAEVERLTRERDEVLARPTIRVVERLPFKYDDDA